MDLSTKKKPEDTNNNIKTEEVSPEVEEEADGSLRARKYSELSECSATSEAHTQGTTGEPPASSSAQEESSNKRVNSSPVPTEAKKAKKMVGSSTEGS